MTQEPPPYPVDDIEVKGQRRKPGGAFPRPPTTGGGGGEQQEELDPDEQPSGGSHPCDDPETAREWNADAAAAEAVDDLRDHANREHPDESGFNEREYGTVLWEMPDGSIIHGPITEAEQSFYEAATSGNAETRGTVGLDWTPPAPGAVVIGTVHTHSVGGYVLSGSSRNADDQAVLTYTQALRDFQNGLQDGLARLYVAANEPSGGPDVGRTRITVYDEENRDAALGGAEGPEVNPEGMPCPTLGL